MYSPAVVVVEKGVRCVVLHSAPMTLPTDWHMVPILGLLEAMCE